MSDAQLRYNVAIGLLPTPKTADGDNQYVQVIGGDVTKYCTGQEDSYVWTEPVPLKSIRGPTFESGQKLATAVLNPKHVIDVRDG